MTDTRTDTAGEPLNDRTEAYLDEQAGTETDPFGMADSLPDELPERPFGVFKEWFDLAREHKITRNPDAFTLATVDPDGSPSARIVLCRKINTDSGHITFFTNRTSDKGKAIAANPTVAAVFHFDAFDKVVRMVGPAVESPEWESDEYFKGRHPAKRLGAWASDQSKPIGSRDDLIEALGDTMRRFGVTVDDLDDTPEARERAETLIPRPPHWGGYRIWPRVMELWVGNQARLHDRARYTRELTPTTGPDGEDAFTAGPWSATRLMP
jgi:pyridoxamine 5'-phosphate oxidase